MQLAAARRSRYAARQRTRDLTAYRAKRRRQDLAQRARLVRFLGDECGRCGLRDLRGLVVTQPAGQRLTMHQLYTLMLHEPVLASAELGLRCATCRQIELFEFGRSRHHEPSVVPSISSPDDQPSESDDHPFSSIFGAGAARDTWARSDIAGVAFG